MPRRHIIFQELKNGSFVCRNGLDGTEFGRSKTFDDAMTVAVTWLTLQGHTGDASVLIKPWRARAFDGPPIQQHYIQRQIWKG